MKALLFSLVWLLFFLPAWLHVGFVRATSWLDTACPRAGCSGILVLLQLPSLFPEAIVWLAVGGLGIAFSVWLFCYMKEEASYRKQAMGGDLVDRATDDNKTLKGES